MAKLSSLHQNVTLEREGVWVDYIAGVRLRIARDNSRGFRAARIAAITPHLERIRSGEMDEDEARKIMAPVNAAHVLTDWSGIDDDDGKPLAYSIAAATELLADPRLRDLAEFVDSVSSDRSRYAARVHEASLGN